MNKMKLKIKIFLSSNINKTENIDCNNYHLNYFIIMNIKIRKYFNIITNL
jgi:hypothetical protein